MKDLIILGASGDLAYRKLFPAIYQNYKNGFNCRYIGYGRKKISNSEFKDIVKQSTNSKKKKFLNKFTYIQGTYDKDGFKSLKDLNKAKIFYLALPIQYDLLKDILEGLKENKLITKNTTIVLEKPFGKDLTSSKQLISLLKEYLTEKQIYLIDHYLAKEEIRNLITLRFGNTIFADIWNNKYIEKIEIVTEEKEGIGNRGEYYDSTGAIKDMIQNHLLQILSLVTMNQPKDFTFKSFKKEKANVLKDLRIFKGKYEKNVEIGQYKGYTKEKYVKEDSDTETYAKVVTEINSKRWKGVPIVLTTGKKLKEKRTEILIYFKGMTDCIWDDHCEQITGNILKINIFPNNNISLTINTESNPVKNLPKHINLEFTLTESTSSLPYANALMDIYNREKSYTPSYEEILLSWKFVDRLNSWIDRNRDKILEKY